MLYYSCFCRLIIVISFFFLLFCFDWRSVVRLVSGKNNFTTLLCRDFNFFSRTSIHPSRTSDAYWIWGIMWTLKNSFLVSVYTMYLPLDRRKTPNRRNMNTLTQVFEVLFMIPSQTRIVHWKHLQLDSSGCRQRRTLSLCKHILSTSHRGYIVIMLNTLLVSSDTERR